MIFEVGGLDRGKEKWSKIDQKTKSETDLHRRSIFDWFLIDFGNILGSKIDQKWHGFEDWILNGFKKWIPDFDGDQIRSLALPLRIP